jgi:hypothetical protein
MQPLTAILGDYTERVAQRLQSGQGMVVVISSDETRRRTLFSALAHTLAEGLKDNVGADVDAVGFLAAVVIDTAKPPELPTAVICTVVAEKDVSALSQAIRAETRQDPFALMVTSVPDPAIIDQLCIQSAMHLVIVGIDTSAYPEVLVTAAQCTESTTPLLKLIDEGTSWQIV